MPISTQFSDRLLPRLASVAERFGTPFHIYDEEGIRRTVALLQRYGGRLG